MWWVELAMSLWGSTNRLLYHLYHLHYYEWQNSAAWSGQTNYKRHPFHPPIITDISQMLSQHTTPSAPFCIILTLPLRLKTHSSVEFAGPETKLSQRKTKLRHKKRWILTTFWGRLRKIPKSDYYFRDGHLCPSVRMEQLHSHWTDFHEIWYLRIFRESV